MEAGSVSSNTGDEVVDFDGATGTLRWTPSVDGAEVTLTVTATDRDGIASQTFTIAAEEVVTTPGNEAPEFTTTPSGPALVGQRWTYFAEASDADGDTIAYSVDSASEEIGITIDAATGRVDWTPQAAGDYPVTVSADDGRGAITTQSFTLSVTISNVPPEITSTPTGPAVVGRTWTYTLTGTDLNDSDTDLEFRLITPDVNALPSGMTWDDATATVEYRAEAIGTIDFVFQVVDPQGAIAEQQFTLEAVAPEGPANRAPLIRSVPTSPATLGEQYVYAIDAIDLDGDDVTLRVTSAALALDQIVTDALSFIPTSLDPVDFVVTADDGRGGIATQTFTVAVVEPASTNRAPRITSSPVGPATAEVEWTYTPAATDPDDDAVMFSFQNNSIDAEAAAIVLGNDGVIRWTPSAAGITLTGTITASDGNGGAATQTFSITSADVPDGGNGNTVPRFVTEPENGAIVGQAWVYNSRAVDDDGDVVTYSLDEAARSVGFSVDRNTGVVSWTPSAAGDVTFTLSADDGRGGVGTQVVTVPTINPNATPQITSQPTGPAIVGGLWSYSVTAIDGDDAESDLVYSLVSSSDNSGVRFDEATATLTWAPTSELDNTFTVRVTDPGGAASEQTFTVTSVETPANRPPVFRSVPVSSVRLGESYRYAARASDPDGDVLTYSLIDGPVGMSIDPSTGVVSWTAAEVGVYDIVIGASDGVFSPTTQSYRLTVNPPQDVNDPPTITSTPSGPAIRGNTWQYPATATDPNGDAITWRIGNLADFATDNQPAIDANSGLVTWTPTSEGRYDFLIEASDRGFAPGTAWDGQQFTLTVQGNLPPRFISSPTLEITVGDSYAYQSIAVDPNTTDDLTYSLDDDSFARGMTLSTDGLLSWADTNVVGSYPVTLRVTDNEGLFDEQSFAFVIQPDGTGNNNLPPSITRTTGGQILEGRLFEFTFEAVDPDGDAVSFQSSNLPDGAVLGIDGSFVWTPTAAQLGEQSFELIATDGSLASAPITVTLEVLAAGEDVAPMFVTDPVTTVVSGEVYSYDSEAVDAGGETVTYFLDADSITRGLAIDANGLVTWNTTDVTAGRYAVTITASDKPTIESGLTDTQSFVIEVSDGVTNNAPEFTSDPVTTALAGGLYTYNARATDADGDDLIFGKVAGPDGLVVDAVTGRVQWIPTTAELGEHTVEIAVVDGRDGLDRQTFVIDVAGANRPPTINSNAPAVAYVGETYRYQVEATDPDGHALSYSIAEPFTTADSNGDLAIDAVTGLLTWTPAAVGTGGYQIQVNVIDEFGLGTGQAFGITVLAERPNNAPRWVAETMPPLSVERDSTYSYDFDATDPDGDPVFYTLENAPAAATIDANGVVTWDVPADQTVGAPVSFRVVATDIPPGTTTPKSTYFNYTVQIQFENFAPTVEPIDDRTVVAGNQLRVDVRARDENAADTLAYSLNDEATAAGLEIDSFGRITWNTDVDDVTTDPLAVTVTVSDGRKSTDASFTVDVLADTSGPQSQITASDASPDVGDEITVQLFAIDDVAVTARYLTLASVTRGGATTTLDQSLELDGLGRARLTIDESLIGVLTFTGYALDAAGNQGDAAPLQLTVVNPNDGGPPTVDLDVANGTELTGVTEIFGTVNDDVPEDVRWSLSIRNNETGVTTSIVKDQYGAVEAGLLGKVDATLLVAGAYTLILSATDSGSRTRSDSAQVEVTEDFKLGNFQVAFTDLEVPVGGITLSVTRSYDSLRSGSSGDFGYGWELEVATTEVRLVGAGSDSELSGNTPLQSGDRLVITLPDGEEESFVFTPQRQSSGIISDPRFWNTVWTPSIGTTSELLYDTPTLTPFGNGYIVWAGLQQRLHAARHLRRTNVRLETS